MEYHVQNNREDEVSLLSHHHRAANSWFSTACLIVCAMAGIGVLGLPAALYNTGWIGLLILVMVCLVSAYTGIIIGRTLEILPRGTGYTEMGTIAFGTPGRIFADFSIYTTLGGVGIIFLILLGLLMEGIVPRVSHGFWTLAFGLVVVGPISIGLRSYGEIKWISYFGFAATAVVVIVATVLSLVFFFGEEYNKEKETWGFTTRLAQGSSFAIGTSVFTFAFGSQAIYPNIYVQMTDTSKWSLSVLSGYVATLLLYLPISIAGYAVYGEFLGNSQFSQTILSTIQHFDAHHLDLIIRILNAIMILHIMSAFPVVVNPLFSALEAHWFRKRGHHSLKLNLLSRSILFLIMLVLALFFPYFLDIMSLISCLSVSLSCFILPCLFYWKICQPPVFERVLLVIIMLFGIVGAVCGTVVAIEGLVSDVKKNPNPFSGLFDFK
eukprot:TRINITY_DN7265_c0_g1_i1.p1 TRINITY_DN7265_c0_g1~~TRINITY_DN7265_c0_g1_i1.p1  ORF type:complete len:437 (-),score=68.34 TRINITY_DN7265_c0_g1_i1:146-1456(-)